MRECAEIAAREASAQGVHWNYSPMVDIGRDPRWGRVAEGYGEDPYLCSRMAEALVRGYQGADLSSPERIAACVKHFAAYGAPLGGRDYDSVEVSERTLREVYLPPFQAAVRAGAASVMAALHDLNGVPMSINHALLHGVLRTEWGFTGLVVSDWGAVADLLKHRVAGDEAQAAVLALQAGIEMDMVSGLYNKHLVELVRDGTVSLELIDSAVLGVLTLKKKLGLFEHPYVDPEREKTQLLTPANREHARRMAQQSCVLLQNKNSLLPLARDIRSVAVVGPFAESKAELLGTWTLDGQAEDVTSIIEGIRETVSQQTRVIGGGMHPESAVAMAQEADAVIAVLGEHPTRSG
ncbi:MAG TPA: glycoside hydrolase family 3 N-terminal domain-containing protein, partial [Oligoflexia bacterium]|nr:glycoside hydrolase family 3 N-terminal domain-containing protein [Oligoflexia bacterium]